MINELRVRDLGVIADVDLVLEEGMTAITGETGAGKTMIVDAIELLLGGRFDPDMVRSGATEATVEGRFFHNSNETVIRRVLPKSGRSRAFLNGSLTPLTELAEFGSSLVDLYGQHAHQSLLAPTEQRRALDQFGDIDLEPLLQLRGEIRAIDHQLEELGGDDQLRSRELDLWGFEMREIDALHITSPNEDEELASEEERLAQAVSLRESAIRAYEDIVGADAKGARDLLGSSISALGAHDALSGFVARLRGTVAELDDLCVDLRRATEAFEEDPARLEEIRERRSHFARIKKKHGETLSAVLAAREVLNTRIESTKSGDERRRSLLRERDDLVAKVLLEEERIGDRRRRAALPLAEQVEARLQDLGLTRARIEIDLADSGLADGVTFLLNANLGEPALPLSKIASGGELSRTMLALRLVLSSGPSTLIFDEVDAGIGGEAALAVGRALRELGREHQVIVVTHLAQVAAFADNQLVVVKDEHDDRTLARVDVVEGEDRVSELARMLSGHPDSENARRHAAELLRVVVGDHRIPR